MKMVKPIVFVLVVAFFAVNSPVLLSRATLDEKEQITLTDTSSLEDYLAYGALNNPGLRAAFQGWQAALERIPQVRALPDPRLTFAYLIREVETRVGPQQAKIGIMQMFPWFGKLKLKGNAALEAANAQKQVYDRIKLNLFYRIKDSYYEYYYVTHAISVIKENIQLLEYLEGAVRARYRTGKATHSDLIKVQVELDKLQDRLKSTEEMLIPVMAKLNSALNRSPRSPLPKPTGLNTNIDAVDYAQMVQWLKEHNPELKAIEHMAAGAKIKQQLARKNYYPDFSIGVDYMLTGEARMPGVPDSGKDPLAAMMTVNLPIRFKKIRASVREAGARFISVNKMREERENNLLARLEMVFYKFNDSGRKLALYKDALIPKAKQALEVTQSAFEAGKVDFLNLIDSQRTLLGFELAYERALSARHQRLAELEMIVGKEFSRQ